MASASDGRSAGGAGRRADERRTDVDEVLERATRPALKPPSLEAQARIRQALLAELSAVEPLPSDDALMLRFVVAFAFAVAGLLAVMGGAGRGAVAGWRAMDALQAVSMSALLGATALLVARSLAWQMIPGSLRRVPLAVMLGGCWAALLAAVALLFSWQLGPAIDSSGFVAEGWPCSVAELVIAIPAMALFGALARRGEPRRTGARIATLAGLAGLLAVTVQQFRCPLQQARHLLVWHLSVPLAVIAIGVLIARALSLNDRRLDGPQG